VAGLFLVAGYAPSRPGPGVIPLAADARGRFPVRVPAPGHYTLWIPAPLDAAARLADGRAFPVRRAQVGSRVWSRSDPVALARGQTWIGVPGGGERAFLVDEPLSWPVPGRDGVFARLDDEGVGPDGTELAPPVLVSLRPRAAALDREVRLDGGAGPLRIRRDDGRWRAEGPARRWSAAARADNPWSRWVLRDGSSTSRVQLELRDEGLRIYAEHRLMAEVPGSFRLESWPGMELESIVPLGSFAARFATDHGEGPRLTWYRASLHDPGGDLRARLLRHFSATRYELEAAPPPGAGLVLAVRGSRGFTLVRCLDGGGVRVSHVERGKLRDTAPLPGASCDPLRVRKAPGALWVSGREVPVGADIGTLGCASWDDDACALQVRVH